MALSNTDDILIPFQLEKVSFRGRILRLGPVLDEILDPHDYPDLLARLTGETACLAALLAGMLKYEGVFIFQVQGDGALKMLLSDVTSGGDVRACASFDQSSDFGDPEKALRDILGEGYAAFTVDQGSHMERYQGIVELKGGTLAECVQHYFSQSEQILTGIKLVVARSEGGHWRAGAIMVQHMPEEGGSAAVSNIDEDDWRRVMVLLGSCSDEELLAPDLPPEDLLFRLFHEEGVRVYEPKALRKGCRCNQERLTGILQTMSADDRRDMVVDGNITMRCEYCSRDFVIDPATLGPVSH